MRNSNRHLRGNQNSSSSKSSYRTTVFRLRLRHLLKPKMMLIVALLFCWNLRNSLAVALYHPAGGGGIAYSYNGIPYYPHSPHHHQNNHHHRTITSNLRLRAPPGLNQVPDLPLQQQSSSRSSNSPLLPFDTESNGRGISLSDETDIVGPLMIRSSPAEAPSSSSSALIPMDMEVTGPRRKKDCGEPSIATRGLLGPTLKRSFFAYTQDEVDQKVRDDEYRQTSERRKRDIQHQQLSQHFDQKRNGGGMDIADSPLPWTCETQYEWEDMGADHYPRFVRTAKCKTKLCFNGFFRCRPRRYKTKVLKRISPGDSTSCEDDDVSLPETLRSQWKFITVTINLCCDCTGRMPGTAEV